MRETKNLEANRSHLASSPTKGYTMKASNPIPIGNNSGKMIPSLNSTAQIQNNLIKQGKNSEKLS